MPTKKLYYAPGIISLVGFLFVLPYSFKRIIPKKETTLKFNVPKKGCDSYQFTEEGIAKDIRKKRKLIIFLNEDRETNVKKLEVVRYEARKLKYTYDTSSVIIIKFPEEFFYGEFIKLLDQCHQDSIRRCSIWGNSFVIFGESQRKKAESTTVGPLWCCDVIDITPPEKRFKEKWILAIKPYANTQTFCLLTGWLILSGVYLYFRKRGIFINSSSTP